MPLQGTGYAQQLHMAQAVQHNKCSSLTPPTRSLRPQHTAGGWRAVHVSGQPAIPAQPACQGPCSVGHAPNGGPAHAEIKPACAHVCTAHAEKKPACAHVCTAHAEIKPACAHVCTAHAEIEPACAYVCTAHAEIEPACAHAMYSTCRDRACVCICMYSTCREKACACICYVQHMPK